MCESHPDIIPASYYEAPYTNHTITSNVAYRSCLDCLKATLHHVTSIEDPKKRTQCQSMVMECITYGHASTQERVACLLFLAELGWRDQGCMFDHLGRAIVNGRFPFYVTFRLCQVGSRLPTESVTFFLKERNPVQISVLARVTNDERLWAWTVGYKSGNSDISDNIVSYL